MAYKTQFPMLFAIILIIQCLPLGAAEFPKVPDIILGVNQPGPDLSDSISPSAPWTLSDTDIELLKSYGVNTIRIPVYPKHIGIDGEKLTWKPGDVFDVEEADKWTKDWRLLDTTLDQFQRHGITPYICPHPYPLANWMTIYIPEDAERCLWYTALIVKHVHAKYGDNVIYGWYENIWKNSMQPWYTGVYRHSLSTRFPQEWHRMLKSMYKGDIENLNKAWKTNYKSFEEAPVWDMGTISGIPDSAFNTRRTYDLRMAIDLLSRERLLAWREELRALSPGALWAGACLHDGFDGYYDARMGNPPACNWSIKTHAMTSDVVAADNYHQSRILMAQFRTVAKITSTESKSYMAVEINGSSPSSFGALASVGGPITGALVWCGKDDAFGLIKTDGSIRKDSLNAMKTLFDQLKKKDPFHQRYIKGKVLVYFPEETYYRAVLKSSHLDAYDHICDKLQPTEIEPVLTSELQNIPKGELIYVLEKHLPQDAIDVLNRMGSNVICPHNYFINENGEQIKRSYIPIDFYAELKASKYGNDLLEAFMRVEEKEHNIAFHDMGATASTDAELSSNNEIDPGSPYKLEDLIDGDSVASRVVFADKKQHEYVDVELPEESVIYGEYVETAVEDKGRTPASIIIKVSNDGKSWQRVFRESSINKDRTHIRHAPIKARFVRFDFGINSDSVGSRIIEIGVLGK